MKHWVVAMGEMVWPHNNRLANNQLHIRTQRVLYVLRVCVCVRIERSAHCDSHGFVSRSSE